MRDQAIHIEPYGDITITTRGVNSDLLTNEVIIFTTETLNNSFYHDLAEEEDRNNIISYLEHFYGVLMDAKLIEQFDIMFDKRNNTRADMNKGMFAVESKFKQIHCLNFTQVTFLLGGKQI